MKELLTELTGPEGLAALDAQSPSENDRGTIGWGTDAKVAFIRHENAWFRTNPFPEVKDV